jgi:hypothetical protein
MVRDHGFLINKRYEAAGSLTVGPILGTEVGFKEFFFEDPAVGAARRALTGFELATEDDGGEWELLFWRSIATSSFSEFYFRDS